MSDIDKKKTYVSPEIVTDDQYSTQSLVVVAGALAVAVIVAAVYNKGAVVQIGANVNVAANVNGVTNWNVWCTIINVIDNTIS